MECLTYGLHLHLRRGSYAMKYYYVLSHTIVQSDSVRSRTIVCLREIRVPLCTMYCKNLLNNSHILVYTILFDMIMYHWYRKQICSLSPSQKPESA